jgi:hypothetical protein
MQTRSPSYLRRPSRYVMSQALDKVVKPPNLDKSTSRLLIPNRYA